VAINSSEIRTPENDPQKLNNLKDFKSYKTKLVNWINERAITSDTSVFDKLKDEMVGIGKERRARRLIVRSMSKDVTANELGLPWVSVNTDDVFFATHVDYFGFGDPDKKTPKVLDELKDVLGQQGTENDTATIYMKDTITGEPYTLTIGKRGYGEGQTAYYSEERRTDGSIISSAIIGCEKATVSGNYLGGSLNEHFNFRLMLNTSGGRYSERKAEINIDSESLPRATIQTLKLSVGAFKQGLKSNT